MGVLRVIALMSQEEEDSSPHSDIHIWAYKILILHYELNV